MSALLSDDRATCSRCGVIGGDDGTMLCMFLEDTAPRCFDSAGCKERSLARDADRWTAKDNEQCLLAITATPSSGGPKVDR